MPWKCMCGNSKEYSTWENLQTYHLGSKYNRQCKEFEALENNLKTDIGERTLVFRACQIFEVDTGAIISGEYDFYFKYDDGLVVRFDSDFFRDIEEHKKWFYESLGNSYMKNQAIVLLKMTRGFYQ